MDVNYDFNRYKNDCNCLELNPFYSFCFEDHSVYHKIHYKAAF